MVILAIMSGSSLDGVDLGLIEISNSPSYEIITAQIIPYPIFWSNLLPKIGKKSAKEFFELEALYSEFISELILEFRASQRIEIDCISLHGHTVTHQVDKGYSVQLGNGGIIASKTGITTLTDFRTGDMAKGGQGAPLMAIVDRDFFSGYCASVNLGGICNVAGSYRNNAIAFDIGPCNQLLNTAARELGFEMDLNANLAKAGHLNKQLLQYFEEDPFLDVEWPKSLDNDQLKDYYIMGDIFDQYTPQDYAKTSCVYIAGIISEQLSRLRKQFLLSPDKDEVLFTGGGCHHEVLWNSIVEACQEKGIVAVKPSAEIIDYKELILMAYLAYLRINNKPNILSEYTSASSHTIGGAIYGA